MRQPDLACSILCALFLLPLASAAQDALPQEEPTSRPTIKALFEDRKPEHTEENDGLLLEFYGCSKTKSPEGSQDLGRMTVHCDLSVTHVRDGIRSFNPQREWRAYSDRGEDLESTKRMFNFEDYENIDGYLIHNKPLLLSYEFVLSSRSTSFYQLSLPQEIVLREVPIGDPVN
jgi:hypothetical protein